MNIPAGGTTLSVRPPRLLILGGGAVVSEFYLPALQALGWIEHVVVADSSATRLAALEQRRPGLRVHQGGLDDVLADPSLGKRFDAAVVALPNHLHESACTGAFQAGLHVLCEKPLALTRGACLRLANVADRAGCLLAVGMTRRLLPSVAAVRAALGEGFVRRLQHIDVEDGAPYAWPSESGTPFRPENGGVLADMGIHYLDLVQHLVGPLGFVRYSDDWAGGVEANCDLQAEAGGVPVRLVLSRTHELRNTAIFVGERGTLVLEKDTFDRCLWLPAGGAITASMQPTAPFRSGPWAHTFEACFAEQFFNFAAAIEGHSSEVVSAREAGDTVAIVEKAYAERTPRPATTFQVSADEPRPGLANGPVVVTGGTGFIGTTLVERLTELGIRPLIVPVRGYRTVAEVATFPVSLPRVDLLDRVTLARTFAGARFVFHLAYGREGPNAARVTVEGTQHVVEAAMTAGVESVVVLSTMAVFGYPAGPSPVNETFPYAPALGAYGRTKAAMEQWCLQRARSSGGTRIVVLNPTCVYGPRGKTYTRLPVSLARQGAFGWVCDGIGTANVTYVENLVDAILLAATTPTAHGQRFIVNDVTTTWRAFLERLLGPYAASLPSFTAEELEMLGREPSFSLARLVRLTARNPAVREELRRLPVLGSLRRRLQSRAPDIWRRVRALAGSEAPLQGLAVASRAATPSAGPPPAWLADLFGPTATVFSADRAALHLGWYPRVSMEEGLARSQAWLRDVRLLDPTESAPEDESDSK